MQFDQDLCPVLANSVDPDQLASALFVIKYVNFYQKPSQIIWLAENLKMVWHLNLFSMTRVKESLISVQCINSA